MDSQIKELLEQCMFPVLLVSDGTVTQVNQGAVARQFAVGTQIDDLICTGKEEYATFTNGKLCLSLKANNVVYPATVFKGEDYDIFQLDWEYPAGLCPGCQAIAPAIGKCNAFRRRLWGRRKCKTVEPKPVSASPGSLQYV